MRTRDIHVNNPTQINIGAHENSAHCNLPRGHDSSRAATRAISLSLHELQRG